MNGKKTFWTVAVLVIPFGLIGFILWKLLSGSKSTATAGAVGNAGSPGGGGGSPLSGLGGLLAGLFGGSNQNNSPLIGGIGSQSNRSSGSAPGSAAAGQAINLNVTGLFKDLATAVGSVINSVSSIFYNPSVPYVNPGTGLGTTSNPLFNSTQPQSILDVLTGGVFTNASGGNNGLLDYAFNPQTDNAENFTPPVAVSSPVISDLSFGGSSDTTTGSGVDAASQTAYNDLLLNNFYSNLGETVVGNDVFYGGNYIGQPYTLLGPVGGYYGGVVDGQNYLNPNTDLPVSDGGGSSGGGGGVGTNFGGVGGTDISGGNGYGFGGGPGDAVGGGGSSDGGIA